MTDLSGSFRPREWQQTGADQIVAIAKSEGKTALVYACPGSGKTFGGLLMAMRLIEKLGKTRHLVVVTPNLAIKTQWIDRAKSMGIELREIRDAMELRQADLPMGVHGFIVNYQQAINMQHSLRGFCEENKPIVILDEVHHTAGSHGDRDGNAWGYTVQRSFASARFVICTTGTPFREGNNPIAFVNYNDAGEAVANVRYSYADAIKDRVCRPIEFDCFDGYVQWKSKSKRETFGARISDPLPKRLSRERNGALVSVDGDLPIRMLQAGHNKLTELRKTEDPRAGGLVVALDIEHALELADRLERISGERPVVVHSKIDEAQVEIDSFRNGNAMWIVGIAMLSEGVDIPRLRVGVYATVKRTPLFFHQFCGRFVRVQDPTKRERAYVVIPSDPEIMAIAYDIEKEVTHALGEEPERSGVGFRRRARNATALEVEESDGESVAIVCNGLTFSREYRRQHSERVENFRASSPDHHGFSDIQILNFMITLKTIEPPVAEVA